MDTSTSTSVRTTANPPWSLAEVDAWDVETFVARLGGVFESSPWIAKQAWASRPFLTFDALHSAMVG